MEKSNEVDIETDYAGFSKRLSQFVDKGKKADFAKKIGVSPWMVSKYLNGSMPSGDILHKISIASGKSMEWLLTGRETIQSPCPVKCGDAMRERCRQVKYVLESKTLFAGALEANIIAFYAGVGLERRVKVLEETRATGTDTDT